MPGQTVLIIGDDAQFRADLTAILGGAGYKALEAHDGRSALAALDEFGTGIDLMVVDLCLPENVSGLDVIIDAARRKTRSRSLLQVPFLVSCSWTSQPT
jgi:DNA-binding response OmpR family regulator